MNFEKFDLIEGGFVWICCESVCTIELAPDGPTLISFDNGRYHRVKGSQEEVARRIGSKAGRYIEKES